MPSLDVFGRIFIPSILEDATEAMLKMWYPSYLREVESQYNILANSLPVPVTYTRDNKIDSIPGEDLPRVTIISPGIVGTPEKSGSRVYRANWRLGVGVAVADNDVAIARRNADIYGVLAILIMLQQGGAALGGHIEWTDAQQQDLPIRNQLRNYVAFSTYFTVLVENSLTGRGGPATPDAEPYDYGQVQTVDVTVNKV